MPTRNSKSCLERCGTNRPCESRTVAHTETADIAVRNTGAWAGACGCGD